MRYFEFRDLRPVVIGILICVLLFAAVSAVVQAVQGGWYLYQTYRYDKRCKRGETQILKTEEVI